MKKLKLVFGLFIMLFAFTASAQFEGCTDLLRKSLRKTADKGYAIKFCAPDASTTGARLSTNCEQLFSKDPDDPKRYCMNVVLPPPDCEDCAIDNELITEAEADVEGNIVTVTIIEAGIPHEFDFELPEHVPSMFTPALTEGVLLGTHSDGNGNDVPIYAPAFECDDCDSTNEIQTITINEQGQIVLSGGDPVDLPEIECEDLKPCVFPEAEDDYFEEILLIGQQMCFDVLSNDDHALNEALTICGALVNNDSDITTSISGNQICVIVDNFTEQYVSVTYTICDENNQESEATLYGVVETPNPESRFNNCSDVQGATCIYTPEDGVSELGIINTKDAVPITTDENKRFIVSLDGQFFEEVTGTQSTPFGGWSSSIGTANNLSILSHIPAGDDCSSFSFDGKGFVQANGLVDVSQLEICTYIGSGTPECPDESQNGDNCATVELCTFKTVRVAITHKVFDVGSATENPCDENHLSQTQCDMFSPWSPPTACTAFPTTGGNGHNIHYYHSISMTDENGTAFNLFDVSLGFGAWFRRTFASYNCADANPSQGLAGGSFQGQSETSSLAPQSQSAVNAWFNNLAIHIENIKTNDCVVNIRTERTTQVSAGGATTYNGFLYMDIPCSYDAVEMYLNNPHTNVGAASTSNEWDFANNGLPNQNIFGYDYLNVIYKAGAHSNNYSTFEDCVQNECD